MLRGDSVWLFSLGGTLDEVAEPPQQSITRSSGSSNAEVSLDSGRAAYVNSCVFCHGADGTGGHGGPAFTTALGTDDIQRIVSSGRNLMPAFGSFLDEAAIANVSAWVSELARRTKRSSPLDATEQKRRRPAMAPTVSRRSVLKTTIGAAIGGTGIVSTAAQAQTQPLEDRPTGFFATIGSANLGASRKSSC